MLNLAMERQPHLELLQEVPKLQKVVLQQPEIKSRKIFPENQRQKQMSAAPRKSSQKSKPLLKQVQREFLKPKEFLKRIMQRVSLETQLHQGLKVIVNY
mgnify:CR=1 FL=1